MNDVDSERRRNATGSSLLTDIIEIAAFALLVSMPVAWITHIIWVIRKLAADAGVTAGQIALGVLGTLVPPVGVLHGYMIWFGVGL